MTYLDISSGVARRIISTFRRRSHGELPQHFGGRLKIKFSGICRVTYGDFVSIFYRAPNGEFSRHFVGRLTFTYLEFFSGVSR